MILLNIQIGGTPSVEICQMSSFETICFIGATTDVQQAGGIVYGIVY